MRYDTDVLARALGVTCTSSAARARVALVAFITLGVVGSQFGLFSSWHLSAARDVPIILPRGNLFGVAGPLRHKG